MAKRIFEELDELENIGKRIIRDDTDAAYGDLNLTADILRQHDAKYAEYTDDSPFTFEQRTEILNWLVLYMQDNNIYTVRDGKIYKTKKEE